MAHTHISLIELVNSGRYSALCTICSDYEPPTKCSDYEPSFEANHTVAAPVVSCENSHSPGPMALSGLIFTKLTKLVKWSVSVVSPMQL